MALICDSTCRSGIFYLFNLLFWISGLTLVAVGVYVFLEPSKGHLLFLVTPEDVKKHAVYHLAYALFGLGTAVVVVGALGCSKTLQNRRALLVVYLACLLSLFILEFSAALAAFGARYRLLNNLDRRLQEQLLQHYGHDNNRGSINGAFTESIDFAQFRFNCCGIVSDADYEDTVWKKSSTLTRNVPLTCCVLDYKSTALTNSGSPISVVSRVFSGTVEELWQHPKPQDEAACQINDVAYQQNSRHTKGCLHDIELWFQTQTLYLIIICCIMSVLQVIGIVFTIITCRKLGI